MTKQGGVSNRGIWLAIILIFAVLVAAGTALAFRLVDAEPAMILSVSGAAFVATVTLGLAIWRFLEG
jgi:hypothetical protein